MTLLLFKVSTLRGIVRWGCSFCLEVFLNLVGLGLLVVGGQGIVGVEDGVFFVIGTLSNHEVAGLLFLFEDLALADGFVVVVDVGDRVAGVEENPVIHGDSSLISAARQL